MRKKTVEYLAASALIVCAVGLFASLHWRGLQQRDLDSEQLRKAAANARYFEVGADLERIAAEQAERNRIEREQASTQPTTKPN